MLPPRATRFRSRRQSEAITIFCYAGSSNQFDAVEYASATGSAAAWSSPDSYNCGTLSPGQKVTFGTTVSVPSDAAPGNYSLVWTVSCQGAGGEPCSGGTLDITIDVVGPTTTTQTSTTSVNST